MEMYGGYEGGGDGWGGEGGGEGEAESGGEGAAVDGGEGVAQTAVVATRAAVAAAAEEEDGGTGGGATGEFGIQNGDGQTPNETPWIDEGVMVESNADGRKDTGASPAAAIAFSRWCAAQANVARTHRALAAC